MPNLTTTDGPAPQMLYQIWIWGFLSPGGGLQLFIICCGVDWYPNIVLFGVSMLSGCVDVPCGRVFDLQACLGRWVGSGDFQMTVRRVSFVFMLWQMYSNTITRWRCLAFSNFLQDFVVRFEDTGCGAHIYIKRSSFSSLRQYNKQTPSSPTPCHVSLDLK